MCTQKRFCKDFEIKNIGEYRGLYVWTDALLLADVSENFQKLYLKLCNLNLAKFLSAPGLPWQADLRKTKVKINLLTDVDMLLRLE